MKANKKMMLRRKLVSVAVISCFTAMPAYANPIGATVVNGQVGFVTQGSMLTVTNSPNSIINWQQFSINSGETTRFIQQSAQSAVLNRVVGQDPSQLLGNLLSNGRVYLINPNGILFGQGAVIDVGGLVASTLKLTDGDFLAGRLNFTDGVGAGSINNQGSITTPTGGNVYLIAPDITNSGVITSPQGEILLAAGHTVNLMDTTNPNVQVTVGAPDTQAVNIGSLIARSGKVGIYGALINQQGLMNADTAVVGANGKITLRASKDMTLEPGSVTTASGMAGGAKDGGEVRIIADGTLNVKSGSAIHVDGGVNGGNGGFLELSGKQKIALNGTYTGAAKMAGYHGGMLLLDPADIVICSTLLACGTGATSPTALGTGGIVLAGDAPAGTLYLLPTMTGAWTNVALAATNNISVNSALVTTDVPAGGSLTLTAGNNITIGAQIGLSSTAGRFNHDLTLTANNNVNISHSIYLGNNTLTLTANADAIGGGNVVVSPVSSSGLPAIVDTLGALNVSGVGLQVLAGGALGETAKLISGNGQTITTSFVEVIANGSNDARITNTGGDQIITTSGMNGAGEGVVVRNLGVLNVAGARLENTSIGLQSITLTNANKLVVDGATASAYISAAGDQLIAMHGAGANAIEVGTAGGIGSSRIEGNNQNITAGSGIETGSITLAAGVTSGKVAYIQNFSGTQDVSTTGALQLLGGTGASTQALNNGNGLQTVNAGDILLQGGGGTGSVAWINSNGGGGQSVTATTGNLALLGGSGTDASARLTSVLNGQQIVTVAGTTTLTGGSGSGAFAAIGRVNGDVDIVLNSTGDVTLTEGGGVGAFAGIGAFAAGYGGPITVNGGGNVTLNGANAKIISDAAGTVTVNAGTAGDITLNGGVINTFGNVNLNAGKNIALSNGTTFYTSAQTSGMLTMNAGNDITIATPIGASSSARFNHNLTLNAGNNVNINASIYMGSNTLIARAGASVDQLGGISPYACSPCNRSVIITPPVRNNPITVDVLGGIELYAPSGAVNILGGSASGRTGNNEDTSVRVHGGTVTVNAGSVSILGGTAHARPSEGGSVTAFANAELSADTTLDITTTSGGLTVQGGHAVASASGCCSPKATASANAELSTTGSLTIHSAGGLTVAGGGYNNSANKAIAQASGGASASANANALVRAGSMDITLSGVGSAGLLRVIGGHSASAHARGSNVNFATTHTDAELSATGMLTINNATGLHMYGGSNAKALANGNGSNNANASAKATVNAGSMDVSLTGPLNVTGGDSGLAHANGGGMNTATVHSDAELSTIGMLTMHSATGLVVAGAWYTRASASGSGHNSANASAKATINAGSIDATMTGSFGVNGGGFAAAYARGGSGSANNNAQTNADASISVSGLLTIYGASGMSVHGGRNAYAGASSSGSPVSGANKATTLANATVHASSMDITLLGSGSTGRLTVYGGFSGSGASAYARGNSGAANTVKINADAELFATGMLTVNSATGLFVRGGKGLAQATGSGINSANASTKATVKAGSMDITLSSGVGVNGGASGSAHAAGNGVNTARINADAAISITGALTINNATGLNVYGGGGVSTKALASGSGANSANVSTKATVNAGSMDIALLGGMYLHGGSNGSAHAVGGGMNTASVASNATIAATGGDITISTASGNIQGGWGNQALASGSGTLSATVNGNAELSAVGALNILVPLGWSSLAVGGGNVSAMANGSRANSANATANALVEAASLNINSLYVNVYGGNANATVTGNGANTAAAAASATINVTGSLDIGAGSNGAASNMYVSAGNANAYAYGAGAAADSRADANATITAGSLTLVANSLHIRGASAHAQVGSPGSLASNRSATAEARALVSVGTVSELTLGSGGLRIEGSGCHNICTAIVNGAGGVNSAFTDRSALLQVAGDISSLTVGGSGVTIWATSALAKAVGSGANTATENADAGIKVGGSITSGASGIGSLTMRGSNARASGSGANNKATATANALVVAGGDITLGMAGDMSLYGGNANAIGSGAIASADANIISGANLDIVAAQNVSLQGGYANVSGAGNTATANTLILAGGDVTLGMAGNMNLYGGNAYATGSGGFASADADIILGGNLNIVTQNANIGGGYANVSGTGNNATANALVIAGGDVALGMAGDMSLYGGSAYASGSGATAIAGAEIILPGNLDINAAGNVYLRGGYAAAYPGATARAVTFVGGYPQTVTITTGNDFTINGASPAGLGGTEYTYAGIVGLQAMTLNVGNNFTLTGGPSTDSAGNPITAYTDKIWGDIGPGTGKWDTPFSPIILNVGGVTTIDDTCLTCAPAFVQLLMSELPPAVLYTVDQSANAVLDATDFSVFIEPIIIAGDDEDKKNEKPVCK